MSRAIDTSDINSDSTLSTEKPLINQDPNSLLTSGPYKREPTSAEPVLKSATVKPENNENRNAMKNQLPTPEKKANTQIPKPNEQKPKPKSEEENVLNEAKSQPVKKQPKAVMKKQN